MILNIIEQIEQLAGSLSKQTIYAQNFGLDITKLKQARDSMLSFLDDIKNSLNYRVAMYSTYGEELSNEDQVALTEWVNEAGYEVVSELLGEDFNLYTGPMGGVYE